jgi:LysR family transcriptional activator of nhaA
VKFEKTDEETMGAMNYKHLHYFWMVAKTGSIGRASARLHVTAQTISGQLTLFEEILGHQLFDRVGRRLQLNDMGRLVLRYADDIFTLGGELEEAVRRGPGERTLQLRVGVTDAVPKTMAYLLLEPAMQLPQGLRIICREGKPRQLLAELATHQLDIVIADSPLPANVEVRGFNHLLGECGLDFFAAPALARQYRKGFPRSLDGAPFLLPGEDAAMRPRLLRWFDRIGIRPQIVGEFDDGALMKAFGEAGAGIFCAPQAVAARLRKQLAVQCLGTTNEVSEQFYAVSMERRLTHPAVVAIRSAARDKLFGTVQPAG